jgi:RNA polymerase sigma factor (sigma-70 family)|tara:strand:- start:1174 stop:1743 length:570 start_codon:yes stop_codon:yes gene_type:complete
MTKKEAFQFLADKYQEINDFVYHIQTKYFQKKGIYHEDITQDLYLKIYKELEKVEEKPHLVLKFLEPFSDGKTFLIYKRVRHMFIDMFRKEKKYMHFDDIKLSANEKKLLIDESHKIEFDTKSIDEKVDDYVETFFWFDKKLFNLFRYDFKTHQRNMIKETKLSKSTIYRTVKRCKIKIKNQFKDEFKK